jgi:hypothetical protein
MGDITSTKPDGHGVVVRTICEVHREIYREIHNLHHKDQIDKDTCDLIVDKLQEAFNYAKKMNNKLRQYKNNYDAGWWERHKLDGGELWELERIQGEINKRRNDESS